MVVVVVVCVGGGGGAEHQMTRLLVPLHQAKHNGLSPKKSTLLCSTCDNNHKHGHTSTSY